MPGIFTLCKTSPWPGSQGACEVGDRQTSSRPVRVVLKLQKVNLYCWTMNNFYAHG